MRIAIFLMALMLCASTAQSQQPSSSDHFHKAKQTNQAHAERPVAKAVELPNNEPTARSEWWLVLLTGALVLVAIVQAGVFYYQGRQLKETVKATRANLDALMNAERALLSFEGFQIIDERSPRQRLYPPSDGEVSSPIAVSVDLKNYGRTPAVITAFWITPIVVETFRCGELSHPHGTVSFAQPIAPSAGDSRTRTIPLAEWSEVMAGKSGFS